LKRFLAPDFVLILGIWLSFAAAATGKCPGWPDFARFERAE
jgi:hypothetical protein